MNATTTTATHNSVNNISSRSSSSNNNNNNINNNNMDGSKLQVNKTICKCRLFPFNLNTFQCLLSRLTLSQKINL